MQVNESSKKGEQELRTAEATVAYILDLLDKHGFGLDVELAKRIYGLRADAVDSSPFSSLTEVPLDMGVWRNGYGVRRRLAIPGVESAVIVRIVGIVLEDSTMHDGKIVVWVCARDGWLAARRIVEHHSENTSDPLTRFDGVSVVVEEDNVQFQGEHDNAFAAAQGQALIRNTVLVIDCFVERTEEIVWPASRSEKRKKDPVLVRKAALYAKAVTVVAVPKAARQH
ncbi:hypothetical protein SCHPADRAFT_936183 [Schizopora paradoxa]|uniref:Uncharacterized protein n=1 Tax=Schizopora paradoxa TaxID=27342 RepID=A0A0H2SN65_9AGAM|nr:hypothetical protein SCHPADRAFT_936183 [Schizopora paradoxa]